MPTRYTAIVQNAHWYQAPLFGGTVSVSRYPDRIVFGSLSLSISFEEGAMLVAKTPELTLSITGTTWSFNGVAGQAFGTISRD